MNHYQKAMTKRQQADEYHDAAVDLEKEQDYALADSYFNLAMKYWEEHAQLLQVVYPASRPEDPIQVTIFDRHWLTEGQPMHVLETSFATLPEYIRCHQALGYDYDLETEQVDQCEMCQEYYLEKHGYTAYKSGFCSLECLNEDEFLRRVEGEYWEEQYAEHVMDSDPNDRDTYFF